MYKQRWLDFVQQELLVSAPSKKRGSAEHLPCKSYRSNGVQGIRQPGVFRL